MLGMYGEIIVLTKQGEVLDTKYINICVCDITFYTTAFIHTKR